ncbi:TPA: hypothetical protein DIT45_00570 [Candidatus Acetothermia bacterium]|nr:hypothetical protein [Candidatus Acetothermia bacterium]
MRFSFNYRHFDDAASNEADISSGRLGVDYDRFLNTGTLGLTFGGKVEIALQDLVPTSGLGQGAGTLRSYMFEEMPLLFMFGGAEASFDIGQEKSNLEIRAGVGYGRFSDVTSLAKALKIQKGLLRKGKIKKQLSDESLLLIADQISQRAEFTSMDELMSAIQTLIEEASGTVVDPAIVMVGMEFNTLQTLVSNIADLVTEASGDPLDAEALMIIQEQILIQNDSRSCGWAVQGGVGYDLVTRKALLTASLDAALAPDPASQIVLRTSFSTPFLSLEESVLNISTSYDYLIKNDISLFANYTLQAKPVEELSAVTHSVSLELALHLEVGSLALQIALTKAPNVPTWSTDVMFSLVVDLL